MKDMSSIKNCNFKIRVDNEDCFEGLIEAMQIQAGANAGLSEALSDLAAKTIGKNISAVTVNSEEIIVGEDDE